jgi:hypothetical protein
MINNLNKIPGNRIILKPIFQFYINIDDIWLYHYNNINYNILIQSTF